MPHVACQCQRQFLRTALVEDHSGYLRLIWAGDAGWSQSHVVCVVPQVSCWWLLQGGLNTTTVTSGLALPGT
jgi:hypothetical protein